MLLPVGALDLLRLVGAHLRTFSVSGKVPQLFRFSEPFSGCLAIQVQLLFLREMVTHSLTILEVGACNTGLVIVVVMATCLGFRREVAKFLWHGPILSGSTATLPFGIGLAQRVTRGVPVLDGRFRDAGLVVIVVMAACLRF